MGRWAQRRRRATASDSSGSPLPLVTLLSATDLGSGVLELHFDSPVTLNVAAVPDATSLFLDGSPSTVAAVAPNTPDTFNVAQDVDPSSGTTAQWFAQPPWIVNPVDLTTSVVVT